MVSDFTNENVASNCIQLELPVYDVARPNRQIYFKFYQSSAAVRPYPFLRSFHARRFKIRIAVRFSWHEIIFDASSNARILNKYMVHVLLIGNHESLGYEQAYF